MLRKNKWIKVSGSLWQRSDVLDRIKEETQGYFTAVSIGGGEQINDLFEELGFPIKFGALGRETMSLEMRQRARDVLEENKGVLEDIFVERGIFAVVEIPVCKKGGVLCHVNGDVDLLTAYNGYDELLAFTFDDLVEGKRRFYESLDFNKGMKLEKIKVVGFPRLS